MKGSIMKLECPDCGAGFYYFGDFMIGEGRIVRAGHTPSDDCKRCAEICDELGLGEETDTMTKGEGPE